MPHVSVKKKLKLASIYQRRTQKIEIKTLIDATPDLDMPRGQRYSAGGGAELRSDITLRGADGKGGRGRGRRRGSTAGKSE